MVIDDDELLAKSTARVLRRDFDVAVFLDSGVALETLLQEDFACVICDVNMPGLTGPDIYQRLLANRPHMASHFLFHTASTDPQDLGAPVLPKPADPEVLRNTVRSLLDV